MKRILLASLIVLGALASAQVTGSKTIGADYTTLSDAFADLNTKGVGSGGVTLNIPAGYSETAPAGGFQLGSTVLNATLSTANPLIIQKNGSGANPLFTGNTGTSATVDAIFKFSGVDYMTIDGIDLKENTANTTAVTLNERGFAFYNLTGSDGCNYNTIKNSKVTFLRNFNNTAIGIYFAHQNAAGTALNPTTVEGTHSYNRIYSNTIEKSLGSAVMFTGYTFAPSPYTLFDQGNDIGGSSAATGNTLTDIGGVAGGAYVNNNYGFNHTAQNNMNVSHNTINFSPNGKGTVGIFVSGTNATFTTNNNVINAFGNADNNFGTQHYGIYANSSGMNLTANSNIIKVITGSFNGGSAAYGLYVQNASGTLTANGNDISIYGVDTVQGLYAATTGAFSNISNNIVRNISTSGSFSNASAIYLSGTAVTTNISNNKISDIVSNGTGGNAYGLYVGGSTANTTTNIFNNLISDVKTPTANGTSVSLAGINLAATGATSKLNVYYNTVNLNAVSTGTNFSSTGLLHTYNVNATNGALSLRNNIIVNTSTPNGTGTTSAFRRTSAVNLENYALSSDNNDFAVGANGFVYFNGTTKYNLEDFKTLVATREANSISLMPHFLSVSGTDADFLKINGSATANELLDNKGINIENFTTDFAGTTRNAATPDLGAYEFTYAAPTVAPDCTTVTVPSNASTSVVPNPVTINWTAANNASSYKVFLGSTAGGSELVNGTVVTGLSYVVNLDRNKTYYLRVVSTNNIGDASGCQEITFSTNDFAFCTPSFPTVEPITNITFGGINNSSSAILNGTSGYENFTNIIGQVKAGTTSELTVSGKSDANDGKKSYFVVFVDWNQNGSLNDAGEVYFGDGSLFIDNSTGEDGKTALGNIAVPSGAKLGQTRMRVKKEWSYSAPLSSSNFTNPCDIARNFGQAEDYTLNVLPNETLATAEIGKSKVFIYPNPVTDILNISDIKGAKSVSVFDTAGRQVKSIAASSAIDLSNLNSGLYIIKLQMENGSEKSFKVIKK
ncbi:T9SS type A sorting domain-containing protein [Epilithonimonas sp. JDS]|uniref:beta strand repeat-containing protein n=1 Tax=Epilithonimonas sp. JDS TaxID=2902797 RepID=UPI001E2F9BA0|nr:T9SS type A sorting domain-containing protein [Epilithonimonas sp. JDS]MCD9853266.1 T9SS type A sorting domain-containing protein [Epilithonimonas sp. JDS]